MSAQTAGYTVAAVLVGLSWILSRIDHVMQVKASADFQRRADDAIDLTGGLR